VPPAKLFPEIYAEIKEGKRKARRSLFSRKKGRQIKVCNKNLIKGTSVLIIKSSKWNE
jgi:hypothetical protein